MTSSTRDTSLAMASVSDEFGWGSDEPHPWNGVAATALLAAAGLYGASLWLVGGLPPLAYLAARTRDKAKASNFLRNDLP